MSDTTVYIIGAGCSVKYGYRESVRLFPAVVKAIRGDNRAFA
jgi:hypothetical protein